MKILIIGGTGNISTPVTKELQKTGDYRITLFNHDKGKPDWLDESVQVISGERSDLPLFEKKLFAGGIYDCVIDMICFEPEDAEKDIQLFAGRTRQFIFCSTVDVFSKKPACYPVTDDSPLGALPSFPYAYKKMKCEELFREANRQGKFKLTVLRPSATYNDSWSPGVHSFGGQTYHLDRIKRGKPIIMHGDGTSVWLESYCSDTASAFIGAVGNPVAYGQAYNVTGDEWMTHNQMWRTIARVMNAPEPDFVYIPTDILAELAPAEAEWCKENFMHNNIYDNSKAKRDLGFRYTIPYEEGVKRCIDYLEMNGMIENSDLYPFYDRIVENWNKMKRQLIVKLNV